MCSVLQRAVAVRCFCRCRQTSWWSPFALMRFNSLMTECLKKTTTPSPLTAYSSSWCCGQWRRKILCLLPIVNCCCWSLLCGAFLRSWSSGLAALACGSTCVNSFFYIVFLNKYSPKWCTYSTSMAGATWNCCHLECLSLHDTTLLCYTLNCIHPHPPAPTDFFHIHWLLLVLQIIPTGQSMC